MSSSLGQFCVNGVPYTFNMPDGLTEENYRQVVGDFAERMSSQFHEGTNIADNIATDNIGLLKGGRLHPLSYTPPEPVPPRTQTHWYRPSTYGIRRQEEAAFNAQTQRKQQWEARNATVKEMTKNYDNLRQKEMTIDVELQPGMGAEKKVVKRTIPYAEFIQLDQKKQDRQRNANPQPQNQAAPQQPAPHQQQPAPQQQQQGSNRLGGHK